ncbi:riboflavin biosynthesis protein RibF [Alkalihalobacillus pseudalcaliphilus]|uniref:riboflavin biosynthesis protein RibF n=1 Tax=Alkalihalobacillus pseudalcaliphilus TaxID=79884 RepID=UPI00064DE0ED|nr:riboflavin biosynthesis protein RibF [Alkalihalobacillus pseudalcaliphilus]KMK77259.1 riboflavin biosynthesis protein RibF [Alkalihalobacillus pseudalcaliphilus]
METIYLQHPIDPTEIDIKPTVMALGYFDGVHKGHQEVIKVAAEQAVEKGLLLTLMTFSPHPKEVLSKVAEPMRHLTPLEDKLQLLEKLGVDRVLVVSFTEDFAKLTPEQFVEQYIINLHVQHTVCGFDFTYGSRGKGNINTLPEHSKERFTQSIVPKLEYENKKISSTHIRKLLEAGQVEQVPYDLNRYYSIQGIVVDGDKRGRKLGFPTANIQMNKRYVIPKTGVYGVRVSYKNKAYFGVCNLGYVPTFNENQKPEPSIEVHLLDFDQNVYGESLKVEWIFRIRSEKKFADFNDLVKQINTDKLTAIDFFNENELAF